VGGQILGIRSVFSEGKVGIRISIVKYHRLPDANHYLVGWKEKDSDSLGYCTSGISEDHFSGGMAADHRAEEMSAILLEHAMPSRDAALPCVNRIFHALFSVQDPRQGGLGDWIQVEQGVLLMKIG
jgi:hypothetical protein